MKRLLVFLRLALLVNLIAALGSFTFCLFRYGPTWDWHHQWEYFYGNRVAIGAALGLAIMDLIQTAPRDIPRSAQEFWSWGLSWGVSFFRVPQPRQPPPGDPPPPAGAPPKLTAGPYSART